MSFRKLILVEGMIGSGKSTISEKIASHVENRGFRADLYHEYDLDHPIRTKSMDLLRANNPENVPQHTDIGVSGLATNFDVYSVDQWSRLSSHCNQSNSTSIIESTYIQNSVMPYFTNNTPVNKVLEIFKRIEIRIAKCEPLFIYLRPNCIEDSLKEIHSKRGDPWSTWNLSYITDCEWSRARRLRGFDALIAFYKEWELVVDQIYDLHTGPKRLIVAPEKNWELALDRICSYVRDDDYTS
jgi:hypothetical protein